MKFLKVSTGGGDEKANRWSTGDNIFYKYCCHLFDRKESDIIMNLTDLVKCPKCTKNDNLECLGIACYNDDEKPVYVFHCYRCNINFMSIASIKVI